MRRSITYVAQTKQYEGGILGTKVGIPSLPKGVVHPTAVQSTDQSIILAAILTRCSRKSSQMPGLRLSFGHLFTIAQVNIVKVPLNAITAGHLQGMLRVHGMRFHHHCGGLIALCCAAAPWPLAMLHFGGAQHFVPCRTRAVKARFFIDIREVRGLCMYCNHMDGLMLVAPLSNHCGCSSTSP